jgi:endonuclease-8
VPEGDTVWLSCQRLNAALAGQVLTRCELRVPQLATTDLTGVRVREVVSRGKHQLFRFANEYTLHTHFRMDGTWRLFARGRSWGGGQEFQIRAVLATVEHDAVGYRLPVVELLPTAEEDTVVGHLGPDLLGLDWDLDEAVRRIEAQPDRTIGEALLDQRNLAGIGNLYKVESLFLLGVHPWTRVADVPDPTALVERARTLMRANLHHPQQNTTGDRRRGRDHWVFGRRGKPCRRCGAAILLGEQGPATQERVTWWCPTCQAARSPIDPEARTGEPGRPRPLTTGGTSPVRFV